LRWSARPRLAGRGAFFLDARRLAGELAQVVELRTSHLAACGDVDLVDARRVQRKRALDADAVGRLADREGGAVGAAAALAAVTPNT